MLQYSKRLLKIHRRVKDLAQGGDDYIFEYFKYIDEIVTNGDMYLFEDVMSKYYLFDISKIGSINNIKRQTWPIIKFNTNSSISEDMSSLFKTKGVYQQGLEIYLSSDNTGLGEIREFDNTPQEYKYYYLGKEFSELTKMKTTGLDVVSFHPNPTQSFVINNYKPDLNYNSNLIYNYGIAIDLLIHQFNKNAYVEDYWVDEYAI